MDATDDEIVMKNALQAVIAARKTVDQARRALESAELFFRRHGMDPDAVDPALSDLVDPSRKHEIDNMVSAALREIERETEESVKNSRNQPSMPSVRRGIRILI